MQRRFQTATVSVAALFITNLTIAQPPAEKRARPPAVVSPEVKPDHTVVFRLHAPKSQAVALMSSLAWRGLAGFPMVHERPAEPHRAG